MALFNRSTTVAELMGREVESAPAQRLPTAPKKLMPAVDRGLIAREAIHEYKTVAKEIGLDPQDIIVEEFRAFLAEKDIPVFNLAEVTSYMDEIAAKDNPTGFGWQWCPVRPKDGEIPMTFGRASRIDRHWNNQGQNNTETKTPASDYYQSHDFARWRQGNGGWGMGQMIMSSGQQQTVVHVTPNVEALQRAHDAALAMPTPQDWRSSPSPAYTRTLPLHALKKIALIEREFKERVVFLVTDYATAAHVIVNPDPFLMAVIPNTAIAHGKGRFIIDVWDEPGFGIDRMVK